LPPLGPIGLDDANGTGSRHLVPKELGWDPPPGPLARRRPV